jgi:hypothetical protein
LLIYFLETAVRLVSETGVVVFITQNPLAEPRNQRMGRKMKLDEYVRQQNLTPYQQTSDGITGR